MTNVQCYVTKDDTWLFIGIWSLVIRWADDQRLDVSARTLFDRRDWNHG